MTRYATNEAMVNCLECDLDFAEREVTITKLNDVTTGECCPRCKSIFIFSSVKRDTDLPPYFYGG